MSSIVFERATFAKAMDLVIPAIESRNTLPILDCVMVKSSEGRLTLRGTDCDMIVEASIPNVGESFDLAIPAKKFRKILKDAPECSMVEAEQNETQSVLKFGKASYRLAGLASADFPDLTRYESAKVNFTMRGSDLRDYLTRVSPAISTEETRYYLNGVFFHEYDGKGCIVATDGHRCHVQEFEAPAGMIPMVTRKGEENGRGIIIPRKAIKVLLDVLKAKKCPEGVEIEAQGERITFRMEIGGISYALSTKTIDGTFPDYRRIIPAQNDKMAVFDTVDLQAGMKAVTVIHDSNNRGIKFDFSPSGANLTAYDSDRNASEFPLDCDYSSEESLSIGFNAAYLKEMSGLCGSSIQMKLADAGAPALISSPGLDGFEMVLMPMRV